MTNATALTITQLTANGWLDKPTGDVFDTGTVPVTVYGTVDHLKAGRLIVEVDNGDSDGLLVEAVAGDNPPAFLAGQGNASGSVPGGSAQFFGPFETARFMQNDGTFGLTLTPDGTIAGTVRVYALPTI